VNVLDCRYVAKCRDQSASEATGIENLVKISHFLSTSVKFRADVSGVSESILRVQPIGSDLLYNVDGPLIGHQGD